MQKKTKTNDLQKGASELLTPIIRPVPRTRQELVNLRSKELEEGKITPYDFAQELKLTDQEFRYAEIFSSLEHLGNGEEAAIEAFEIEPGSTQLARARSIAKRMGKHQGVITLINALLSSQGWNEANVRKQHLFLIQQNADFKVKSIAIKLWYDVNGLLKKEQNISIKHSFDYSTLSTDELLKMKELMNKASNSNLDITDIEEIK